MIDPSANPLEAIGRGRSISRRRLRRRLLFSAALVATWLLASLVVAYKLTHRARQRSEEPTPRAAWAEFESHRLPTSDGQEIGAWFAEGRADSPSVVLLHGNGGNRGSCLNRAELLSKAGYAVMPITLRAHGDSTGDFNDLGYSARHDVISAVEFLEARRPGRPIFILGASLGAAAATFASSDLGSRVSGYLLEAPYDDLKVAVRNRTSHYLPVGLEWVAYQGLLLVSPLVLPDLGKISPRAAIGGVPADVPVLLIAGRHDEKARPEQVEGLYDRVRSHGRFVIFENAGHLRYQQADPELYRSTVLGFLEEATAKKAASK